LHFVPELVGGKSQVVGAVPLEEHTVKRLLPATGFGQFSGRVTVSLELGRDPVTSSLIQLCAELVNECMAVLCCLLYTKEENLIDLAADSTLPQTKVKETLRDIARERRHLQGRLDTTNADLTDSAQLIDASLALLEQPDKLYRRCDDQQRRLLNQAIFHALYIEDEEITDGELREPFGQLHAIQRDRATATSPQPASKKATRNAGGPCSPSGVEVLLRGLHSGTCSSKTPRVEVPGIEPGSSVASSGLLRAQSATSLLGSTGHADEPV